MPPDKTIDIFLSYSRNDSPLMRRLYKDLQAEGFTVWIDQTNLTPGTPSWQRAVEAAIHEAGCMVVLLSPEAKQSTWVEIEVSIAEDLGLLVIPLLAKGDDSNAVLFRLRTTHRIDLRQDYQAAVQGQLVPALQQYLQRPQAHQVIVPHTRHWWQRQSILGIFGAVLVILLIVITHPYWRSFGAGATPTVRATPIPTALLTDAPLHLQTATQMRATDYFNRGLDYNSQAKYDLAIADYTKAIELDPTFALAYNNRGDAYYNQAKYVLAMADYTKAIELDPNLAFAHNNRGNVYKDQAKYDLAIADYTKAIELDPMHASTYNNRGDAYYHQAKYDLAMADLNKAIELDPNYADAHYNRGVAYQQKGNKQAAIADFQKAADLYQQQDKTSDQQKALNRVKELQQ